MLSRSRLIDASRSIIPALDLASLEELVEVVEAIDVVSGIGGYKLGGTLALQYSLPYLVDAVHEISKKPLIYDQQKACTDIPDTGPGWAKMAAGSGVDSVILFPLTGPATQKVWTEACMSEGLRVIVGAEMTHKGFLRSEGGCICSSSLDDVFNRAIDQGVRDFVIPGNKVERVQHFVALFEERLGAGGFDCYSPGLVTQGGKISDTGAAAGEYWHGIVGRAINDANDRLAAALEMVANLT